MPGCRNRANNRMGIGRSTQHIHLGHIPDFLLLDSVFDCFDLDGDGTPDDDLGGTMAFERDAEKLGGLRLDANIPGGLNKKGKNQFYVLIITGFDVREVVGDAVGATTWDPLAVDDMGVDIFALGETWTLTLPQSATWFLAPQGNKKNACSGGGLVPHTITFRVTRTE